jgi:hypothetical protein
MAAQDERHAAWQQEVYAVYELLGETRVLIGRARTFLDAVDAAAEYLEAEDPDRVGKVPALEIVDGSAETVWRYAYETAAPDFDPIAHWGFDALRWRGPERPRSPRARDGARRRNRPS